MLLFSLSQTLLFSLLSHMLLHSVVLSYLLRNLLAQFVLLILVCKTVVSLHRQILSAFIEVLCLLVLVQASSGNLPGERPMSPKQLYPTSSNKKEAVSLLSQLVKQKTSQSASLSPSRQGRGRWTAVHRQ